ERAALQALEQRVTTGVRRLEESAGESGIDIRRLSTEEAAAFEELAAKRLVGFEGALRTGVEELPPDPDGHAHRLGNLPDNQVGDLQHVLRHQQEQIGEMRRLHESMSEQVDEVRGLATELQRRTEQSLAQLNDAGARQIEAVERSVRDAVEKLEQTSASEGRLFEQQTAAFEQLATARAADVQRAANEVSQDALDRAQTALAQTADGFRAEFAEMLAAARSTLEQSADRRLNGLGGVAG